MCRGGWYLYVIYARTEIKKIEEGNEEGFVMCQLISYDARAFIRPFLAASDGLRGCQASGGDLLAAQPQGVRKLLPFDQVPKKTGLKDH
jgi:hypothetical protein